MPSYIRPHCYFHLNDRIRIKFIVFGGEMWQQVTQWPYLQVIKTCSMRFHFQVSHTCFFQGRDLLIRPSLDASFSRQPGRWRWDKNHLHWFERRILKGGANRCGQRGLRGQTHDRRPQSRRQGGELCQRTSVLAIYSNRYRYVTCTTQYFGYHQTFMAWL